MDADRSWEKYAEAREVTIELLRICNKAGTLEELMRDLMGHFRNLTGCEAIGVRLRQGDDFPYHETRGFPGEFVRAENRLCAIDGKGEIVRDGAGHPLYDCMCGNILCGRFDPSRPFFTARGSFWSSCTTDLLASTTDADRQAKTRNRCNGEGYESVALVPLRSRGTFSSNLQQTAAGPHVLLAASWRPASRPRSPGSASSSSPGTRTTPSAATGCWSRDWNSSRSRSPPMRFLGKCGRFSIGSIITT